MKTQKTNYISICWLRGSIPNMPRPSACAHYAWENNQAPEYLEFAHSFMERHKAMLLLESMLNSRKYRKMMLDQSLMNAGDSIKSQLIRENSRLIALQQNPSSQNQSEIWDLTRKIHRLEIDQKHWLKSLDQVYAKGESLKETPLVKIKNVQDEILEPETIAISYFLEDSSRLHVLCFDKKEIHLEVKMLPDSFLPRVKRFIELVQTVSTEDEYWHEFVQLGRSLHQVLLGPVEQNFHLDNQRLIIVPDGLLALLPFEVLLTKEITTEVGIFKTLPYLAIQHPISYTPSLTLLYQQQEKYKHVYADQVLGLAYSSPGENTDAANVRFGSKAQNFSDLKGSFEEVSFIKQLINGNYRTGNKANKNWFLQHAERYGIIHLAVHGTTTREIPRLIFRSENTLSQQSTNLHELYLHEIYNLHLQANLTVLSACETGKGFIADGEGILSLARGFTYAGSHSILMSLWKANDKSSAQIMKNYYQQLAEGKNKDAALFLARKSYLMECGPYEAHPAYWAAFILQGNREKLELDLKTNRIAYSYVIIFLLTNRCSHLFPKNKSKIQTINRRRLFHVSKHMHNA